jgi:aryl-alcohol dehydrogenase-like predicted oxidoreductase
MSPPMQPRTLGLTGLAVSPLGLGLAALGRPGYMTLGHDEDLGPDKSPEALGQRAAAVLDAAHAAGVRYFDAARSYGRAEEFLASWLEARALAPGAATVGSKWGYTYTAGWRVDAERHEVKEHGLATFERQLAESRALLGPHLELYQIHSATLESGVLDDARVLAALGALRDAGVRVGLTTTGARQAQVIARARAVRVGGARLFSVVQASWNLCERSVERALAEAHEDGLGVIVKEGLANGRLAARDSPARGGEVGAPPLLREVAAAEGVAPDALALAAALARPFVDVVLSGAVTPAQLAANVEALRVGWTPALERALMPLAEEPQAYWAARARLPWT